MLTSLAQRLPLKNQFLKTRIQMKHSNVEAFATIDPFKLSGKHVHVVQNLGKSL